MNATTTMERQPRSGSDVAITLISHGPKGDVVNKITRRQVTIALAVVVGMFFCFTVGSDALSSWAKQYDTDARRPAMEKLADEGKDQAALWMVQHYPQESSNRLPALVAKGYAEALYYQGALMQYDKGEKIANQAGLQLIQQAADQGYLPAIQFLENNKG